MICIGFGSYLGNQAHKKEMADAADRKRNVRIAFQSDDKGDDNYQNCIIMRLSVGVSDPRL